MEKKIQTLLMELMNNQTMTGNDLAKAINMSSRTVRTCIKELNELLPHHGAHIESNKTVGYMLELDNPELFLEFMKSETTLENDFNDSNKRLSHVCNQFIATKEAIKLDDLAESMFLSRTQLKQTIKQLRVFLALHDLKLTHKAHIGMQIVGSEINRRLALAHFDAWLTNESMSYSLSSHDDILNKIADIVQSCIQNADYEISDDIYHNLITHLFITYERIKQGQFVPIDEVLMKKIKEEPEYEIARHIMSLMATLLNIEYIEAECSYITIHLCGKNSKKTQNEMITNATFDLAYQMIQVVSNETGYELNDVFQLQIALAQHLMPLEKRIHYQVYLKNPLLDDIKKKLFVAYEIALVACDVINDAYHCNLPEDEVAYFALHINLAIERNKNEGFKKNILIVCSSGIGSAQLLKHSFMEQFANYVKSLDVCSLADVSSRNLTAYSCIFTTVPIDLECPVPIVLINHFISHTDVKKIKLNLLHSNNTHTSLSYFKEQLFYVVEEFPSKEAAISMMVEKCRELYDLPDDFEEEILKRENIASTEFNEFIAFPHASRLVCDETFVSVVVLKKPLLWNRYKIRIILLACIENKLVKELDEFYHCLTSIISRDDLQWKLIQKPTYATLMQIIDEVSYED